MLNFLRVLLVVMSVMTCGLAYADSHKTLLPHCDKTGVKTKGNELILNPVARKPQESSMEWVYVLRNISKKTVYINHPADHPGTASAGWSSRLDSEQWSALLLNKPNFAITCQNSLMNNRQSVVSCKKVLKICRFKPHALASNKQGSYWIGENQPLNKLAKTLKVRGINSK